MEHSNIIFYPQLWADSRASLRHFRVDLRAHRSRPIDTSLATQAALILAVDTKTMRALQELFPSEAHKMHLLSAMSGQAVDIADPEGISDAERQAQIFTAVHDSVTKGLATILGQAHTT